MVEGGADAAEVSPRSAAVVRCSLPHESVYRIDCASPQVLLTLSRFKQVVFFIHEICVHLVDATLRT